MARSEDEPPRDWKYWVDDKGFDTAVRDYYPNTFKEPALLALLMQRKSATEMIHKIMGQKAGERKDDDDDDD